MKNSIKEVERFCVFLSENQPNLIALKNEIYQLKHNSANQEDIDKHIVFTAKKNGFDFNDEDLRNYQGELKSVEKLNDNQLREIVGGSSVKHAVAAGVLSLIGVAVPVGMLISSLNADGNGGGYSCTERPGLLNLMGVDSYLKEEKISKAQEEAFKITNSFFSKSLSNVANLDKISSYRYSVASSATELERQLDSAVRDGDLPIRWFTLSQINSEAQSSKSYKSEKSPTFEIVKGVDALKLSEVADDGSIVQVASQFNALESMSTDPSPVKEWIYDYTQGPRASLQSVAAAKHREAAHLQKKLPDAIYGVLEKCILSDGNSILRKYPSLYENGYLQLFKINSEEDLKTLRDFLKNNINEMKFLSQWVKCEGTGKKQLQVFSAAPSFQGFNINWGKSDDRTKLLREICEIIVSNEYKAIAQAAAIKANQSDKSVSLHLTLVGQGAFQNPISVIKSSMDKVKEALKGTDVKVYLHGWNDKDCIKWEKLTL